MTSEAVKISVDSATGGVVLSKPITNSDAQEIYLHPIWLRERAREAEQFDPSSQQRLFDPYKLDLGLKVTTAQLVGADAEISFSDGVSMRRPLTAFLSEIGWETDPLLPPASKGWDKSLTDIRRADWTELDDPQTLKNLLDGFFRDGFCLMENTPHHMDALRDLASRFGFIRETNFGQLFNVRTKIDPTDLAYTSLELSAHTDNPYRVPVPGIQFLHCLENEAQGGLGTLMDGLHIAEALRDQAPDEYSILRDTPVKFRYESSNSIFEDFSPHIHEDARGRPVRLRFSPRVSYVPPLPNADMKLFYAARARLGHMVNDPNFRVTFPYKPGTLLMMDNYRLLHGRTAYDDAAGHRHLQGCYIDHDGINSLYRVLRRDGTALSVARND